MTILKCKKRSRCQKSGICRHTCQIFESQGSNLNWDKALTLFFIYFHRKFDRPHSFVLNDINYLSISLQWASSEKENQHDISTKNELDKISSYQKHHLIGYFCFSLMMFCITIYWRGRKCASISQIGNTRTYIRISVNCKISIPSFHLIYSIIGNSQDIEEKLFRNLIDINNIAFIYAI